MYLILSLLLLTTSPQLQYQTQDLPQGVIHTLVIPQSQVIEIAQTDSLATVTEFAEELKAIAVLNGGFFDPQNQLSTSYIIQNSQITANPRQNPRLVNNPDLEPYL